MGRLGYQVVSYNVDAYVSCLEGAGNNDNVASSIPVPDRFCFLSEQNPQFIST